MGHVWRDSKGRFSPRVIPYDHYVVAEMTEDNKVRSVVAAHVKMSRLIGTLQECRQTGCVGESHKPFSTQKAKQMFRLLRRTVAGYKTVRFASGQAV
jgi:hypothetical protein